MTDIDLRQEWETPPVFWAVIDREFDFELDACASIENTKCSCFLRPEDDGLLCDWLSRTWCNPGFSKIDPWMEKAHVEASRIRLQGAVMVVMGLVNPSTEVWNKWGLQASEIRLLSPRVQFVTPPGVKQTGNPRDNALFIYRWNPHRRPPDIWTWKWDETLKGDREPGMCTGCKRLSEAALWSCFDAGSVRCKNWRKVEQPTTMEMGRDAPGAVT